MKAKTGSIQQIRDQFYYIEIVFYNQIEKETPISIPFFLVDSLIINESLHNFITSGQITLNIAFEGFNRGTDAPAKFSNTTIPKIKAPYIDRTDGRNKISIRVYPVINVSGEEDEERFPKNKWEMSFDFIVTDVQDLPTKDAQIKKRTYKFVEERYQILKERNLEWSTAQLASKKFNKPAYKLKDSEIEMNPNEILKELIKLTASNQMSLTNSTDKLKIGYDENGSIDNPSIPFDNIDDTNWEYGDRENKLKYYSPANSNAFDDLNYILSHCSSSTKDPVILDFGRSSNDKKWHLISINKFFKISEPEQIEILMIEDSDALSDGDTDLPKINRASYSDNSSVKNFMSPIASRIQKYKFSPMVTLDDNRITNAALHYYDFSKGEFNIKIENNTAKSVLEKLKELAKGLYTFKNSNNSQIVLNLNKTKTSGLMFKNELSKSGADVPEYVCRNQMVLDAIFLNQSITFQVYGLTIRSPGRFIHIDRLKSSDSNPFDDRFLGQWFITKVSHLFTSSTYITEVVAVKVDSFGKLWPEEDIKY